MRKVNQIIFFLFILFSTTLNAKTKIDSKVSNSQAVGYFSGGCFWCTESDLEKINGVTEVISGYSGGAEANPTYEDVSSKKTGHIESVKVIYDTKILDYKTLLQKFLLTIDVTDSSGQFVDRGPQYRSAIFYTSDTEKKVIDEVLDDLNKSKPFTKPVVTEVLKFKTFYNAEDYHQNYYKTSSLKYSFYRKGSGRDRKLKSLWKNFKFTSNLNSNNLNSVQTKGKNMDSSWDNFKKPSKEELQKMLNEEQFKVTQKDGTEKPFENAYNANKADGIYVDIVSGEPLFSSKDKYDSGTGWPSFAKPIVDKFVKTKTDFKMILPRTEVRSRFADSHLGHVFKDGPKPTGLRYCMNSASMRFVPKGKMKDEGYEEYLKYLD